jgi:hypothetical protein
VYAAVTLVSQALQALLQLAIGKRGANLGMQAQCLAFAGVLGALLILLAFSGLCARQRQQNRGAPHADVALAEPEGVADTISWHFEEQA